MIKVLIYWLVRNCIARSYDVFEFLREWPFVLFLKEPDYTHEIHSLESRGVERLAVVTPHPTSALKFTLRNVVEGLVKNDYTVVVLTYRVSDLDWLKSDFPEIYVAPRGLRGRDFGAWKFFLLAVLKSRKLKDGIKRLVLANDSMYYTRDGTYAIVKSLSESNKSWACIYENNEIHYHAQSFFLAFSADVLKNHHFPGFWTAYQPYSTRKHSIDNGEVGLSRVMTKGHGMPDCYISTERLLGGLNQMTESQALSAIDVLGNGPWVSDVAIDTMRKLSGALPFANGRYSDRANIEVTRKLITDVVVNLKESKNPSHSIGILANQLFGAPLKRDICYRGISRIAHVMQFATGYSKDEIVAIDEDLRAKGVPESLSGMRKVLALIGRL